MGHMKRILDEDQARIDQIVRWWQSHENVNTPRYLLKAVVEDEQFFTKVAELWEADVPAPIPASRHVALQTERRQRKQRKWDLSMSHGDAVMIMSMFSVITVIAVVLAIWMAVTI